MEATPKVHRHRHRRSDSRHHRHERQSSNSNSNGQQQQQQQQQLRQSRNITTTITPTTATTTATTTLAADAVTTIPTHNAQPSNQQLQQSPTSQQLTHSNAIHSPVRERRGQARTTAASSQSVPVGNTATATATGTTTTIAGTEAQTSITIEIPTALTQFADERDAEDSLSGGDGGMDGNCAGISVTTVHERRAISSEAGDPLAATSVSQSSTISQPTVLLVNGHSPPPQEGDDGDDFTQASKAMTVCGSSTDVGVAGAKEEASTQLESPTAANPNGGGGGGGSSRNSSGDALSLRETLQQLPPTLTHGHRHRRTHSPQSPARRTQEVDASFHRGILGFMDRELKHSSPTPSALSVGSGSAASGGGGGGGSGTVRKLQSLSDPQASPAQRSVRSRSSLEKSPRRKRSKSESRRRRERKLIAAGEMEVRQANETLMRYLKQCSEMNDASLSGELEIDQNFDERRVHRKTKSQRDKRGHLISKLYSAGGLSSILRELSDDIIPADGEEIYNPFTPVVSPTEEDTPAHIDKMFLQTSSGYRPVEHCYYKHSFVGVGAGGSSGGGGGSSGSGIAGGAGGTGGGGSGRYGIVGGTHRLSVAGGSLAGGMEHAGMLRASGSFGDTRCLLDAECGR
ncbi:PREDICTED: protein bunched, class 2/F/G isoform-like [Rhagoletis zephyria]|uniref:protein bunched, class 2/F/G isoform-like n=1 Tax=Rhagoletis zephyria TaxID=28612 RepID=UPI0008119E9B|nr:PREDICTED: protein bunched, class 2/F/G isoform-like [Rhagoletis zephyria]